MAEKLLKSRAQRKSIASEIADIRGGRWPSGLPAFKIPLDIPEQETIAPEAAYNFSYDSGSAEIQFAVPNGAKDKQVVNLRKQWSHVSTLFKKELDLITIDAQILNLQNWIKPTAFIDLALAKTVTKRQDSLFSLNDALGVEVFTVENSHLTSTSLLSTQKAETCTPVLWMLWLRRFKRLRTLTLIK